MDVEAIEDPTDLEKLRPEWDALWERCVAATPFQHPGWLLPWWRTFGSGQLFTFAVRAKGRLIALAPLFLHPWNGRRQVTFLGNGVSDYLDILCEPHAEATACSEVMGCIADRRHRWDLCDLQDLRRQSALLQLQVPFPLQSAIRAQYVCSVVSLPDTLERFEDTLPHGLRRNLRRYRSQLQAEGPVQFQTASAGQYQEHVDALVALHQARWNEKDGSGMLSSPSLERFHRGALDDLWQSGLVRFHSLRLNGTIAAIVYALVHRDRAYSYLGGFDPALARFSPGALIMKYTIDQAIKEGVREFDFLRGSESYKSAWGARPSATSRLLLWHEHVPTDLLADQRHQQPTPQINTERGKA